MNAQLKDWKLAETLKRKTTQPKSLRESLAIIEQLKTIINELKSAEPEPVAQLKQLLENPGFELTANGQLVLSQLEGLTAPGIVNELLEILNDRSYYSPT